MAALPGGRSMFQVDTLQISDFRWCWGQEHIYLFTRADFSWEKEIMSPRVEHLHQTADCTSKNSWKHFLTHTCLHHPMYCSIAVQTATKNW